MDTDLIFLGGVVFGILSIPAIISAMVDGRVPRAPALIIMLAAVMIGYAVRQRPGAYTFETLPDVVMRVLAGFGL
ncbi:hypothetical protein AN189_01675 [Loktanella sp. 3ANDIMAR09]|uniref:hypothetical protein n=1 Tax=Loktanella sp. 3ANDIMAR09 TaxID=1225657 RepID=UPI000702020C|nr:hypothetical protein [Loktanella sp. 3ANDIMAR09]KQI70130.1 hypothetical protein AN189_01675 [Loktanella sp. 3ANDIMAR09]